MAKVNKSVWKEMVIAGAIIVLVVLGVISQCSDFFQTSKLKGLEKKVDGIEEKFGKMDEKLGSISDLLNGRLDAETQRANTAEADAKAISEVAMAAEERANAQTKRADAAEKEVVQLKSDYNLLLDVKEQLAEEKAAVVAEANLANRELGLAQAERDEVKAQFEDAQAELEKANANLATHQKMSEELSRANKALESRIAQLESEVSELKSRVSRLEAQQLVLEAEVSRLVAEVAELDKEVAEKESRVKELNEEISEKESQLQTVNANVSAGNTGNGTGTGTGTQVAVIPDAPSKPWLELSPDGKSVSLKWDHPGADTYKVFSSESGDFLSSDLNEIPEGDIDHAGKKYKRDIDGAFEAAVGMWVRVSAVKGGMESAPSAPLQIKVEDFQLEPEFTVAVDGRPFTGNTISVRNTVATVSLTSVKYATEYRIGTSFYELNRSEWKAVSFPLVEHVSFQNLDNGDEDLYIEVRNQYGETRVEIPIKIY